MYRASGDEEAARFDLWLRRRLLDDRNGGGRGGGGACSGSTTSRRRRRRRRRLLRLLLLFCEAQLVPQLAIINKIVIHIITVIGRIVRDLRAVVALIALHIVAVAILLLGGGGGGRAAILRGSGRSSSCVALLCRRASLAVRGWRQRLLLLLWPLVGRPAGTLARLDGPRRRVLSLHVLDHLIEAAAWVGRLKGPRARRRRRSVALWLGRRVGGRGRRV